ncbi:MAG: hypothetical protein WAV60_12635, partial [Anaerolineae bacterium]
QFGESRLAGVEQNLQVHEDRVSFSSPTPLGRSVLPRRVSRSDDWCGRNGNAGNGNAGLFEFFHMWRIPSICHHRR